MNEQRLVDKRVIANALDVCPATVLRLARNGEIPFHRVGGRLVRFNVDEVLRAVKQRSESR